MCLYLCKEGTEVNSLNIVSLLSDSEIMRPICCEFWQFNCWTFQVSFVICTNSFIDSTWASSFILDLRLWRTSLSYILGSGLSKSPLVLLGSMFFVCGLSFYLLDMVDSHLLLSLAGSVHCNMALMLVKHSCV